GVATSPAEADDLDLGGLGSLFHLEQRASCPILLHRVLLHWFCGRRARLPARGTARGGAERGEPGGLVVPASGPVVPRGFHRRVPIAGDSASQRGSGRSIPRRSGLFAVALRTSRGPPPWSRSGC